MSLDGFFEPCDVPRRPEAAHVTKSEIAQGPIFSVVGAVEDTVAAFDKGNVWFDAVPGSSHTFPLLTRDTDMGAFAAGTMITTSQGQRPIDTLQPGDQILTRDAGFQPVLAVLSQEDDLSNRPSVKVSAGFLGADSDMVVSPGHRFLVCSARTELLFGCNEVLVEAGYLVNGDTVCHAGPHGAYCQVILRGHHILRAGGVWAESYDVLHAIETAEDPELASALRLTLPEVDDLLEAFRFPARPSIDAAEARVLSAA
jgi:hypothetical protein